MRYVILRMYVNGIKSIDNEIELCFSNDNLNKNIENKYSKVKAIYGANGAGKTGIVYAVDIYQSLMLNPNYLRLNNANDVLGNVINQNTKKLSIKMVFAEMMEDNFIRAIYSHFIEVTDIEGKYIITEESFKKLSGYRLNAEEKYKTIFCIKNGEFITSSFDKSDEKYIFSKTANLLKDQSMVSIFIGIVENMRLEKVDSIPLKDSSVDELLALADFVISITVIMQSCDKNFIDIEYVVEQLNVLRSYKESFDAEMFDSLMINSKINQKDVIKVLREDYEDFQKYVEKLCKFIKVFKEELSTIEIKSFENGDDLECDLIMVYNNGTRISRAYESTGIKKAIELYTALCQADEGYIVFIDEFDANLHDVLLTKLVEYFVNYSNGQLIFTTHNLGPMTVLKKEKFSIDFLSSNSKITSWKSNGNYTPDSLYRQGLIENSPFNIEAFSFLGLLGDK